MTVSVLWLFLTVPWVDLRCVIVVFPDHTHSFCILDQLRCGVSGQVWYLLVSGLRYLPSSLLCSVKVQISNFMHEIVYFVI